MTAAQRFADAVQKAKTGGVLSLSSNPLDVHRFAINWLLEELERLEKRVEAIEGDGK